MSQTNSISRKVSQDEYVYLELMLSKKRLKKSTSNLNALRCAVYARKSQEDTKATSLPTQIEYCKELISTCNLLEYKETYQEDDVSGMFTDNRSEFNRMIDDVKSGKIDVIVCYKWDRFSRKLSDIQNYYEMILKCNGYVLAGDSIQVIDAANKLFIQQIFWSNAEYQARTSAERTITTMISRSKNGKYMAGETPIGYKRNSIGELDVDVDEAEIVIEIFDSISAGFSLGSVADTLNSKGFTTRTGSHFTKQSIDYIARNSIYTGTLRYNRNGARKKKHRLLLSDYEEVVVEDAFPAIISKDVYNSVQSILDNKLSNTYSSIQHTYLLTGLIYCKNCGKRMVGSSNTGR